MEDEKKPGEKILESAGDMVETYRGLITVGIVEHVSLGLSMSMFGIVSLVFGSFVLLFAGLGSAWWVGEQMNNMKAGFFIVGSAFVVILLILILTARGFLLPQIRNLIIRKIYEQNK